MRAVLLFSLLCAACLQPVAEGGGPRVTACYGGCPAGVCTECTPPDAGCSTPECELARYTCSKSTPCDAYENFSFPAGMSAYCVVLDEGGTWSVSPDGGSRRCDVKPRSCDAGVVMTPAECSPCVRKTYCVGP